MASNLRVVPQSMPMGSPQQQGWVWNGTQWCWDPDDPCQCPPTTPPFPCPPSGFPTPCPPWFPPPAGQAPWYPGANGGVSFSSTPPVNPIRGNFWWDGVMLHLFDGAAWVDIGPSSAGGGGTSVGTSPPLNPAIGTTWWNGTIFQVWDGNVWKLVGASFIGSGAPSAPQAGQTWWNGTVFQVWDGTQWNNVAAAEAGQPVQFAITCTTAKTLPGTAGSWGIVPITDAPQVDLMSGWNAGTHQWLPNKPGNYIFFIRGFPDAIALVKNDNGSFTSGLSSDIVVAIAAQTPPDTWITASGVAQMNGMTDYVRLWARSAASSFPATGANPCFSAAII